jgi:hypothetical protein
MPTMAVVLRQGRDVVCRIQVAVAGDERTITIAGSLRAEHVSELLSACGEAAVLSMDLTDLLSVDPIAADALRRIRDRGARLIGVPEYIRYTLDSVPYEPPGPRPHGETP